MTPVYSVPYAIAAIIIMCIITFALRAFPFIFLNSEDTPNKTILYLGKALPPAMMMMLIVYCMKGVNVLSYPYGIPEFFCILLTILLHLWKRNNFISIFGSTVVYMVLVQFVFI